MGNSLRLEEKTCSACGIPKPLVEFGFRRMSTDGRQGRCLVCARAYSRNYYDRTSSKHQLPVDRVAYMHRLALGHKELMASLKNTPCLDCGLEFPASCMEFDHVLGVKRHTVAEMSSWSRTAVLEEIAKCQVVCCACHRVRTDVRRPVREVNTQLSNYRSWIGRLKNNPCMDCSKILMPVAMDFDHVRGVKVASISNMWSFTRDEVLQEIQKCDLVCANCHRLRTINRMAAVAA